MSDYLSRFDRQLSENGNSGVSSRAMDGTFSRELVTTNNRNPYNSSIFNHAASIRNNDNRQDGELYGNERGGPRDLYTSIDSGYNLPISRSAYESSPRLLSNSRGSLNDQPSRLPSRNTGEYVNYIGRGLSNGNGGLLRTSSRNFSKSATPYGRPPLFNYDSDQQQQNARQHISSNNYAYTRQFVDRSHLLPSRPDELSLSFLPTAHHTVRYDLSPSTSSTTNSASRPTLALAGSNVMRSYEPSDLNSYRSSMSRIAPSSYEQEMRQLLYNKERSIRNENEGRVRGMQGRVYEAGFARSDSEENHQMTDRDQLKSSRSYYWRGYPSDISRTARDVGPYEWPSTFFVTQQTRSGGDLNYSASPLSLGRVYSDEIPISDLDEVSRPLRGASIPHRTAIHRGGNELGGGGIAPGVSMSGQRDRIQEGRPYVASRRAPSTPLKSPPLPPSGRVNGMEMKAAARLLPQGQYESNKAMERRAKSSAISARDLPVQRDGLGGGGIRGVNKHFVQNGLEVADRHRHDLMAPSVPSHETSSGPQRGGDKMISVPVDIIKTETGRHYPRQHQRDAAPAVEEEQKTTGQLVVSHRPRSRLSQSTPPTQRSSYCTGGLLPCTELGNSRSLLVLDLDETLVHADVEKCSCDFSFTVEAGGQIVPVYVKVRPFAIEFLQRMSQLFEMCIFTASMSTYANKVIDHLDPQLGRVHHRLFREHCTSYEGSYTKDLTKLGRHIHRLCLVDNSPVTYALQPENGFPVVSWFDDPSDNELLRICPALEHFASSQNFFVTAKVFGIKPMR